jgi:hypothetical protein
LGRKKSNPQVNSERGKEAVSSLDWNQGNSSGPNREESGPQERIEIVKSKNLNETRREIKSEMRERKKERK